MKLLEFTFAYRGFFVVVAENLDTAHERAADDLPPGCDLELTATAPHDPAGGDGPDD